MVLAWHHYWQADLAKEALPGMTGSTGLSGAPDAPEASPSWDADEAVTQFYTAHYRSLVRLSALMLHDTAVAEEVVQDAFVSMHGTWRRLRDPDKALAYLRQSVANGSAPCCVDARSPTAPAPPVAAGTAASAEYGAMASAEHDEVLAALRLLPERQRETLVLRYYGDLSEADIATRWASAAAR